MCVVFLLALATAQAGDTNILKSLTLDECIARALAHNLDVQIQRLNPHIQSWGVVAAQGVYDPTLSGAFNYTDSSIPLRPDGSARDKQLESQVGLGGKFASGATYGLTASDTRFTPVIGSNFVYTGTAALSVSQPLLKNFGFDVNSATIRIARKSRDIAIQNFLQQVINTISAVENAYYELVFAIEDFKAKRDDRALAQQLLDEDRKRLQTGTISPLDVTQAEAGVAERQRALIVAERTIKDNENALKLLISQDVSEFAGTSVVPADPVALEIIATDVAGSVRTALQSRPDYRAAQNTVEQQNILIKFNRNQLWPEVDVKASYGYNTGGDNFNDSINNYGTGRNPVWAAGVTLSFPLGDRASRAGYHSAKLQAEQLLLQLKRLEQQIIVEVDNAVGHVQSNWKGVEAAREATRLANESYKAEKTKLLTGSSTTFLVLQAASQLADARSAQIRAEADYNESLVTLAQTEGTTLQRHHVQLNEEF
jgi:outer membrane protein TolC